MPLLQSGKEFVFIVEVFKDVGSVDLGESAGREPLKIACIPEMIDIRTRIGVKYFPARSADLAADMKPARAHAGRLMMFFAGSQIVDHLK